jgi:Ca-activated chloride channel family protein
MPDLAQIHLMRPEWLWAAVPAMVFILLLWRQRKHSGGWSEVIAPDLLPFLVGDNTASRGPNLLPFIILAWLLAVLAAAGPSWEKIPQPIHQKQDAMVLVLDLSYSMMANDLAPSRLDRARQKLLDLLAMRKEGQTGLVAYAGDSHIVTPLTDDNPTIANLLPVLSPGMMPLPGSNTPAAIDQAIDLMHSAGVSQGQIILVTDGVDKDARAAVQRLLRGSGMQLSVLGVGTATGAPIPLPRGDFLKDRSGTIVIPKLDQSALQAMAAGSGGRYLNIQIDDSDLDIILTDTMIPGSQDTLALDRTADTWDDQGYLFVLLLLPLVLPLFRRGWVLGLLPVLLLGAPDQVQAQAWDNLWLTRDQQGQRALQSGDAKAAAELFETPQWSGTAAYQGEDYEAAAKHFSEGASADDWYNRGNALAKDGKMDDAISAYKESLTLAPDQTDAIDNLELLEKMKQQQEQQNDQENQQDDKEEQSESDENSDSEQDSASQQPGEQTPEDKSNEQDSTDEPPEPAEDQQPPGEQDNSEEPQESEQPAQPEESKEPEESEAGQAQEAEPGDEEEDQAMQQWLRRIPDDPSGLLREKFKYESQQRQESGETRQNEKNW